MKLRTKLLLGYSGFILALGVLVLDPESKILPVLIVGLLLDIPLYSALKHKFSRPRPYEVCRSVTCLRRPRDRFSFPSGHTSVAFVILWILGTAYMWLFAPLAIMAVLIAASRVYLGVHYPSDVFAGGVLGSACAAVALWLL